MIHVAATPNADGSQSCQRCGMMLHRNGTGAPPPWYPGQFVSQGDQYFSAIRYPPLGWPECLPRPEAA